MEKFEIELVRRDKVKVELDPEYFTEEWLEDFRQYFYDFFTLKECAEHMGVVTDLQLELGLTGSVSYQAGFANPRMNNRETVLQPIDITVVQEVEGRTLAESSYRYLVDMHTKKTRRVRRADGNR